MITMAAHVENNGMGGKPGKPARRHRKVRGRDRGSSNGGVAMEEGGITTVVLFSFKTGLLKNILQMKKN